MKEAFTDFLFSSEYIIQLFGAEAVVTLFLQKREKFIFRVIFSFAVCLAMYLSIADIETSFPGYYLNWFLAGWIYFVPFMMTVAAGKFCFEESFFSILFCCSAAQAMQHLAHRVRNILMIIFKIRQDPVHYVLMAVIVFIPIYAILYFIFFKKLKNKEFPNINNKNMIFTVTACVVLCLFIGVYGYFDSMLNYVIFDLAMILVCFFILCYQFSFLDNTYQKLEYENMCRTLQEMAKQYTITKENIEIINIKCHDIKKRIRILGEKEELDQKALGEITDAVRIYDSTINTGNPVLNVILTDKSLYCEQNQIRFGCMIDGENLQFISSMDMYSLFGNLLDNAIEAVKKLKNPEKAVINLSVRKMKGVLLIHCENYFDGNIVCENGLPLTTKNDTDYHGFGIKSIRFVAEKYGGTMTITPEEDIFNVNITIPLNTCECGENRS